MYARKDWPGVNCDAFLSWAKHFTELVKDLNAGGCKGLLTLDSYRSHMSVKAMCHFEEHGVLCYGIPYHTSGKTQPADVRLFGSFKQQLNPAICSATDPYNVGLFNVFEFARILTSTFCTSFTRPIIISSFSSSRVWPIDSTSLLDVPRLKNVDEPYN